MMRSLITFERLVGCGSLGWPNKSSGPAPTPAPPTTNQDRNRNRSSLILIPTNPLRLPSSALSHDQNSKKRFVRFKCCVLIIENAQVAQKMC